MKKPYTVSLDLYEKTIKSTENSYVQGDSDVYPLYIKLLSNGDAFTLPAGAVISINFENQKTGITSRGIAKIADASKGIVLYNFLGSEICLDGEIIASVVVQNADERLTWQKFKFYVDKSLDDGRNVVPTQYVPWTAQIDAEISKIKKDINSIEVVGGILDIDEVKTDTLSPEEPANVNVTAELGKLKFSFQIPKGEPGKDGKDGKDGIGEGGSSVKVNSSGDLVIDDTVQTGLNADKLGGRSASEFARRDDIPGAVPLPEPTLTLTNLFQNPTTFTGWTFVNAALDSVNNGIITFHNTHSTTSNPAISPPSYASLFDNTHKYFISWKIKASHKDNDMTMLSFYNTGQSAVQSYTLPDRTRRVSAVTTAATIHFGNISMFINGHTYTPNEYSLEFSEPVLVDLTKAFGEGNEPTTNWCVRHIGFFEEEKTISIKDHLKAKMICLGDSNTANGVYGYVDKLNVDAVNAGWGSACMAQNTGVTQSFAGPNITDALISGDFSVQTAAASTADYKRNLEWIKRADPKTIDFISYAYGTNDFNTNMAMGSDDWNDRTKTTFKGAMRYTINAILTSLPHAKLVFITPSLRMDKGDIRTYTNTKGLKLEDYVNAIIEICAYYHVTVIDMYHMSGINEFNASAYLYDGLHGMDSYHEIIAGKVNAAVVNLGITV